MHVCVRAQVCGCAGVRVRTECAVLLLAGLPSALCLCGARELATVLYWGAWVACNHALEDVACNDALGFFAAWVEIVCSLYMQPRRSQTRRDELIALYSDIYPDSLSLDRLDQP